MPWDMQCVAVCYLEEEGGEASPPCLREALLGPDGEGLLLPLFFPLEQEEQARALCDAYNAPLDRPDGAPFYVLRRVRVIELGEVD